MNSDQAKKLDLPEIMARLGYYPARETKDGLEKWYNSPFRSEKEASFHTSFLGGKWIWNDFGDEGGTVIDFVMRHQNYSSVKEALSYLRDLYGRVGGRIVNGGQRSFSFQQQASAAVAAPQRKRELELVSAKPITNPVILSYLTEKRGLSKSLVLAYLKEVRYKNHKSGKTFFAFGLENIAGGYEIRAASDEFTFKSVLGSRAIAVLSGFKPQLKVVNIFEGMTDLLSLLTLMKTDKLNGDCIVMNSLSSYDETVDYIRNRGYETINLFLDNDKAGNSASDRFRDDFGQGLVEDQSPMFLPFADLNDMLVSQLESKTD